MKKKKVIVLTFTEWYSKDLEEKLNEIVNDGYRIQDSNLEFYRGTVSGVYVFTIAEEFNI